jgi:hypothetical protein
LVIAESTRFPELAQTLHDNGDARHIARLADHIRTEFGQDAAPRAQPLFTLLLGEEHRKRLLGLLGPVSHTEAEEHTHRALALLGLAATAAELESPPAVATSRGLTSNGGL